MMRLAWRSTDWGQPSEEQFIIYRKVAQMLKEIGVHVLMPHIESMQPPPEMAGISITICRLDDELKALLYDPADTLFIPIIIKWKRS